MKTEGNGSGLAGRQWQHVGSMLAALALVLLQHWLHGQQWRWWQHGGSIGFRVASALLVLAAWAAVAACWQHWLL
jgi:hypothetical protein